jgi:predicted DNA-binding transcriptional regulator YafY
MTGTFTRKTEGVIDPAKPRTYTRQRLGKPSLSGMDVMPDYTKYRSMLHHLMLIDQQIRTQRYPNATTLGRELELSPRTIARKIEFMRDVLDAPIAYDAGSKGYYYSQPNWSLPNLRISEGELLGLAMAQMALNAYKGTPLEGYLRQVAGKIQATLPGEVNVDPTQLADVFRFHPGPMAIIDPAHWELLAKAIRERRAVQMLYYSMSEDKTAEWRLDPYLLRCYRGDWYLIGRDQDSGNIPMFHLARIRKLKMARQEFEVVDGFTPEQYLSGTFGVFHSKQQHQVKIQFSGFAGRYIPERLWHETQKLTRRKDGSVVLEMQLADINEVGRWVLTWGKEAKALGPSELVAFVKTQANETASLYA